MPDMDRYDEGVPSWVELQTSDRDAAKSFYAALFGWEYEVGGPETDHYTMPQIRHRPVAGMMAMNAEMAAMGVPPNWATYVNVASADEFAARAAELGGTVVAPPFDVMDFGRMAVALDTEGAAIGAWQTKEHLGAGVANEPGAFCWNELYTNDPAAVTDFYSGLFGWTAAKSEGMDYTEFKIGDRSVAGMMSITPEMGPLPPNWLVYFAVADTDATCASITANGGAVVAPPMDIMPGRFAVATDPQGAVFGVIAMATAA